MVLVEIIHNLEQTSIFEIIINTLTFINTLIAMSFGLCKKFVRIVIHL